MDREPGVPETLTMIAPNGRGHAAWWGWCLWLPACVGFAAVVAWVSYEVAEYFSPLLIFPLLVGSLLGASIVALMRLCQVAHRPIVWATLALSVLVVVVGQHYLSYRAAVAEADRNVEQVQRARAAFGESVRARLPVRPDGLLDYLRRQAEEGRPLETVFGTYTTKGAAAWTCWSIDALLVLLPAVLMLAFALRRPFCAQCGSWYATRRSGRLGAPAVRRLGEAAGLAVGDSAGGGTYRFLCCNQGCAPSGFALSWEEPPHVKESRIIWLDDARRDRVVAILDDSRGDSQHADGSPE